MAMNETTAAPTVKRMVNHGRMAVSLTMYEGVI
jgi:hypothetical protein